MNDPTIRCGNIGDDPREIEFEPLEPTTTPIPEPIPAAPQPQPVPA